MTKSKCKYEEINYKVAVILDIVITFFIVLGVSIFIHETGSLENWLVGLLNIDVIYANIGLTALFGGFLSGLIAYISFKIANRER